ncbi:MAG: hypothetical protein LBG82_03300 [Clostridiales Family XIII bacterium]|jgi:hypothetical protein|nr:hypothetical protein [Clostridiales Family XIII bacterium]
MNSYRYDGAEIDSVELKALLVSRGLKVDKDVYRLFSETHRLGVDPRECNCIILSDGTIVQLTDMGFHLKYLSGILSWNNLKLLRYASKLATPFSLRVSDGKPALFYNNNYIDTISLPPPTDFYRRRTALGTRFVGNSVLQGLDWVSFQCLWPCEYAAGGRPCQFCFSGGDFETLAKKGKPLPPALDAADVGEITGYAVRELGVSGVQLTGGSTMDGKSEARHIREYLAALEGLRGEADWRGEPQGKAAATSRPPNGEPQGKAAATSRLPNGEPHDKAAAISRLPNGELQGKAAATSRLPNGEPPRTALNEILLYITPPNDRGLIDEYFALGATRVACSLELWDTELAKTVTSGKVAFTTRERHLDILAYIAEKHGPSKAFSNFIIGIEPFESLSRGAAHLAERGILPTASVWMPMGRPVLGSMTPPGVDYYRRTKELFAELYTKHRLTPPETRGLNVCIESDILRYASGG